MLCKFNVCPYIKRKQLVSCDLLKRSLNEQKCVQYIDYGLHIYYQMDIQCDTMGKKETINVIICRVARSRGAGCIIRNGPHS